MAPYLCFGLRFSAPLDEALAAAVELAVVAAAATVLLPVAADAVVVRVVAELSVESEAEDDEDPDVEEELGALVVLLEPELVEDEDLAETVDDEPADELLLLEVSLLLPPVEVILWKLPVKSL